MFVILKELEDKKRALEADLLAEFDLKEKPMLILWLPRWDLETYDWDYSSLFDKGPNQVPESVSVAFLNEVTRSKWVAGKKWNGVAGSWILTQS